MKRTVAACLAVVMMLAVFAASVRAEEGEEATEAEYIIGVVTGYKEGKNISVKEDDTTYTFTITGDTEVSGDVSEGAMVEVEAVGGHAIYIDVMDIVQD